VSSIAGHSGSSARDAPSGVFERIAAGIDGFPEGRDAAALGAAIALVVGAELLLVAVHPDPLVVLPREVSWAGVRKQAEQLLRRTRDEVDRDARIKVVTDWSVPRALGRVVEREHRDLLVVGSSRKGPAGRVRMATSTRQLLSGYRCALAVAPRGFGDVPSRRFARVGVGYDGGPESRAALSVAASIAVAAGARLVVRGVVDDRLPMLGWSEHAVDRTQSIWDELLKPMVESLRDDARNAVAATGSKAEVDVLRWSPPDALRELSEQVDLLVIGSRRWGAAARVLLGGTGERIMHDAGCPILVTPRIDG
jgi:nucleotide-binding universal stress UspA family protein